MKELILLIIVAGILVYLLLPYFKTLLDKQRRETMENICETKYHMNKYKYKNKKIQDPYSYADVEDDDDNAPTPIVYPNLPSSISSLPYTLQTLNNLGTIKDTNSSFNIVGKNNRITGFFTDTSFYK